MKPLIETCDDWLALVDFQREVPDLLKQMTACCRSVSMAVTDRPVVFTLFNPITQAIQLAGLERFKEHGLTAPEKVRAGIERIAHNTRFAIDAFIEAGVKGIYYVTQHMQRGLIDPWVYSDFGMDADAGCLARAAGLELSIFHIHGERVFLMLPEMPANGIIHYELTADNMSPGMFHEKYPYRLMPGIPFSAIRACESDDDIRSCIDRHLVSDGGDGFMAAGCVLPVDFPEARIRRWVELSKAV